MNEINFIAGGMMGDFIHCLSVVKNICKIKNAKANIYLTDDKRYGGDAWKFTANAAHKDLYSLVAGQEFINKFELLPASFNETSVNLNQWRATITRLFLSQGFYSQSWSEFLSLAYNYETPKEYKWLSTNKIDKECENKIVIHRSLHRHNENFQWKNILDGIKEEIVFVTSSKPEYDNFEFRESHNVKLKIVLTIEEMANVLYSSKYFIGNQSMPFALACALDIPRMVELDKDAHAFYMNEEKYSSNISWYFNDNQKYISGNSFIKP